MERWFLGLGLGGTVSKDTRYRGGSVGRYFFRICGTYTLHWSESYAIPRMRNAICIDSTLGEYRSALINIESIKLSS
jgi:hypothetical protein